MGLKAITGKSKKVEINNYIKRLKKWHSVVHQFDRDRIKYLHKDFQRHWGIVPSDIDLDSTFNYMRNQISDDVFSFVIDFQVKEFARRIRSDIKIKEEWFESVASQLAGARPENWNDDDYILYIERIKNFRVRIDEAIELSRKNALRMKYKESRYKEKNKALQEKILQFINKEKGTDEGKIAALIRVQEKLEKKVKKNN